MTSQRATASVRDELFILATESTPEDYERLAEPRRRRRVLLVVGQPGYLSGLRGEARRRCRTRSHRHGGLWIAPAAPGFDARLVGGTTVVPRKDGETLRREYDAAVASSPDAVGLISWNEFSENTHVEPSENHGMRYLDVLADVRGETLEVGGGFDSSEPSRADGYPVRVLMLIGYGRARSCCSHPSGSLKEVGMKMSSDINRRIQRKEREAATMVSTERIRQRGRRTGVIAPVLAVTGTCVGGFAGTCLHPFHSRRGLLHRCGAAERQLRVGHVHAGRRVAVAAGVPALQRLWRGSSVVGDAQAVRRVVQLRGSRAFRGERRWLGERTIIASEQARSWCAAGHIGHPRRPGSGTASTSRRS